MPKSNTKKKSNTATSKSNSNTNTESLQKGTSITKKSISLRDLTDIKPLTTNQGKMIDAYMLHNKFLAALGSPGTGKSLLALYLGLRDALDKSTPITHIRIVRSAVQGREIGHMPGDKGEKEGHYSVPYKGAVRRLFKNKFTFDQLVEAGLITFDSTSFNRGDNWDDCVVILDEVQNMKWSEIYTACTRLGETSKLIICGDKVQCDLSKKNDLSGIDNLISVIEGMEEFERITFTKEDCVRSGFVKSWLYRCEDLNLI